MRILIYIPIYERPEITKTCLREAQRLIDNSPYEGMIHCVVSESWASAYCRENGISHTFTNNNPVGTKLNTGLKELMKHDFDYLLSMGSDNILSDNIWQHYTPLMEEGIEFFGIDTCYFHEASTGRTKKVCYDLTIIAGNMIKKEALERTVCNLSKVQIIKGFITAHGTYNRNEVLLMDRSDAMNYQRKGRLHIVSMGNVRLYDAIDKGLNNCQLKYLVEAKLSNKCIPIEEPMLLDLKSEVNIWKYDDITRGEEVELNLSQWLTQDCLTNA